MNRHASYPCFKLVLAVLFLYLHEMISQFLKIDCFCVRSFVFCLPHISVYGKEWMSGSCFKNGPVFVPVIGERVQVSTALQPPPQCMESFALWKKH